MRKIIAAVLMLTMMLGTVPAFAQEDEALSLVRAAAEEAVQDLLKDAQGWEKLLLENAQVSEATRDGKNIKVKVMLPVLNCGTTRSDRAEDGAAAYLQKAVAPCLAPAETAAVLLGATCKEQDGQLAVKWGSAGAKHLKNRVKSMARETWETYQNNEFRQALNMVLIPRAVDFGGRKPEEAPPMDPLREYAAQVAPALGWTEDQASRRLPCMMMLMNISRVSPSAGLDVAVLTVHLKDWETMLDAADAAAREAMLSIVGVPEMSADEVEAIFCAQLPAACVESYFTKRGQKDRKITVNVLAASSEGPGAADGLMEFFQEYGTQVEAHVASLMDYGKTLPYYPKVEQPETGILTGAEAADGSIVLFDMGGQENMCGYVCIRQNGQTVASGYVQRGERLMVRLEPGEYEVYCTAGEEWFGEGHMFGREATFGQFMLTVNADERAEIHMEDAGGNLPVAEMTEAAFQAAIGQ